MKARKFLSLALSLALLLGLLPTAAFAAEKSALPETEVPRVPESRAAVTATDTGFSFDSVTGTLTITSNDGTTAWRKSIDKDAIKSVVLDSAVTKIGSDAFNQCMNLTNVSFSDNVTEIGNWAFIGCVNLALIELPAGLTKIQERTFNGCKKLTMTSLPAGLTEIGDSAFSGCSKLALTELPAGLTKIGPSAFRECAELALTELPAGLTKIEAQTFFGCEKLALTALPDRVTEIGEYAFLRCYGLNELTLPADLIKIDTKGFVYCSNLNITKLPDTFTKIEASAFEGCRKLNLTALPEQLTEIGDSAFKDCENLALTALPETLTKLGKSAFSGCLKLALTELPAGLTEIGQLAFYNCKGLERMSFHENIKTLGSSAFYFCSNLSELTFLGSTPPAINEYTFSSISREGRVVYPIGATGYTEEWKSGLRGLTNWTLTNPTVAVTDVAMTNAGSVMAHTDLTLTATVEPEDATNQTIVWSVKDAGGTGAAINGNTFRATAAGTATVLATIENGAAWDADYTKEFNITVKVPTTTLVVQFNENGTGGTSAEENGMKEAIASALASEDPSTITTVKTIKVTGTAGEITGWNWADLMGRFQTDSGWTSLEALDLSEMDGLTKVENDKSDGGSFPKLQSVHFPAGLKTIGTSAFAHSGVLLAALPESLETMGDAAFASCASLTGFTISVKNERFSCLDGVLYTKDKNTLLLYPPAKNATSFTIPNTVQIIGASAFAGCDKLNALRFLTDTPPASTGAPLPALPRPEASIIPLGPAGSIRRSGKPTWGFPTGR